MLQTEEEFLFELTQDLPDDSVDRDDEDEREDESEFEDSEEDEELEREKSQNGQQSSQSLHLTVERRADVGAIACTLQQEGEMKAKTYCSLCVLCFLTDKIV